MTRMRWLGIVSLLVAASIGMPGCVSDDEDDDVYTFDDSPRAPRAVQYLPPGSPGVKGARNQRASGSRAR